MRIGIHAASIESPRIQAFIGALRRAGSLGLTTRDLIQETGYCAISAIAAECRALGLVVRCEKEAANRFRYRLIPQEVQQELFK